jgi:hypothetical protein
MHRPLTRKRSLVQFSYCPRNTWAPPCSEEAAGREKSSLATHRARAAFPTGKTFDAWDERLSSVPAPPGRAADPRMGRPAREARRLRPSGTGKTFMLEALGRAAVAAKNVA